MLLKNNRLDLNYYNVAVALFKLFPDRFGMVGFSQYPDGWRIANTVRRDCIFNKYTTGSIAKGWRLTETGISTASKVESYLKGETSNKPIKRKTSRVLGRELKFVKEISESSAYSKWISRKKIDKFELCDMLHGTLDTPLNKIQNNLMLFSDYARIASEMEEYKLIASPVLEFLKYVRSNWGQLIND